MGDGKVIKLRLADADSVHQYETEGWVKTGNKSKRGNLIEMKKVIVTKAETESEPKHHKKSK